MEHYELQIPEVEPRNFSKSKRYEPVKILWLMIIGIVIIFATTFINATIAQIAAFGVVIYIYYAIDQNFQKLYKLIQYNREKIDEIR